MPLPGNRAMMSGWQPVRRHGDAPGGSWGWPSWWWCSWLLWRHRHQGQARNVPDDELSSPFAPWPTPAPREEAAPKGPPFVTSVSPNGRYFLRNTSVLKCVDLKK